MKPYNMKPLNDVIKAWEFCQSNPETCEGCPYELEYHDTVPFEQCYKDDALHYLKEYRESKEMLSYWSEKAISEQQNIADAYMIYKIASEKENPPLTWDELRTMEGKPVWIDSVPLVRRWVIIKKFHPIGGNKNLFDMEVEDGAHFLRKNMRRDDPAWWLAYRKER